MSARVFALTLALAVVGGASAGIWKGAGSTTPVTANAELDTLSAWPRAGGGCSRSQPVFAMECCRRDETWRPGWCVACDVALAVCAARVGLLADMKWWYNWWFDLRGGAATKAQFVPMIWGPDQAVNASNADTSSGVLLGFNEPDQPGGNFVVPADAAKLVSVSLFWCCRCSDTG